MLTRGKSKALGIVVKQEALPSGKSKATKQEPTSQEVQGFVEGLMQRKRLTDLEMGVLGALFELEAAE